MQFRLTVLTSSMYVACVLYTTEAGFWDEILTKALRVFLLDIHSHLCFALRFLFLQTHATSDSFYRAVTKQCKGDRRKTWLKTIPPSLWFKKSIQKYQVWELSRLCLETFSFRTSTRNMVIFLYVYLRFEREILGERTYYPLSILALLFSVAFWSHGRE
jgi:hypothetical protein